MKLEMKSLIKKRHLRFCLILVGFCVALLFAEGFVRVFYPYSRDHVVPGGLFEIDDYLGWKLTEGKSAIHHSRYFDAIYRINTLGYRDMPRNLLKDIGIYRFLLYGDSQIFGWGTPAEKRFSNLLEDQKLHWEMWNLGVPGYGLDQQVLSYVKQGQLLNADEVIFFVSKATLNRTRHDYIYRKHKPKFVIGQSGSLEFVPVQQKTNVWTRTFYNVLSPMYLPYFVDRRLAMLKQTPKQAGDALDQKTTAGSYAISELAKKILDRVRNLTHERKHRMTIIVDLPNIMRNDLENFCNQRGIGFWQIVFPKEWADLTIGKHDAHWSNQAQKLIAKQLLSQLETRILPAKENK